jgi:hypothetical protein
MSILSRNGKNIAVNDFVTVMGKVASVSLPNLTISLLTNLPNATVDTYAQVVVPAYICKGSTISGAGADGVKVDEKVNFNAQVVSISGTDEAAILTVKLNEPTQGTTAGTGGSPVDNFVTVTVPSIAVANVMNL